MSPVVLPALTTEDWMKVEEGFRYRWNYPNCIGALDGKHVVVQRPPNSHSLFHNYKGTFSMVLLALVDHQYKFLYVDFGEYGSNSDTNVFKNSKFGKAFIAGKLGIPGPKPLPGGGPVVPHCIVADEGFPLRLDMMRPYSRARGGSTNLMPHDEAVYNARESRARNPSECAFGIYVARWRIYLRRVCLSEGNIERVVQASLVLHNWLQEDRPVDSIMAELRETNVQLANNEPCMRDLPNLHGYHSSQVCLRMRDQHKEYFNTIGALPWQDQHVRNRRGN